MDTPDPAIAMMVQLGKPSGDANASEVVGITNRHAKSATDAAPVDPDGFSEAFDVLATISYRVAYRILGSRAAAEDVSQESLTRAYLHWRRVHTHAEPWVAKVAGNLAIDAWRHRESQPVDTPRANTGGHDLALDRIELVDLLRRLPRRQRQVLVLRYLADQSEAATAEALGCSTGAVKRHAHRALTALRASITADHLKGDPDV